MSDGQNITIRVKDAMRDIAPAAWDACANPDAGTINPFLSHAFLNALEESGCVGARTGWLPQHLVIEDGGGALARRDAALSEVPQPGRICLRPWLGRCL